MINKEVQNRKRGNMTRKKAIEFGKMWLKINEDCKDSNTYEFFEIAIKELEKETVPKGLYEYEYYLRKEYERKLDILIDKLEKKLKEKKEKEE